MRRSWAAFVALLVLACGPAAAPAPPPKSAPARAGKRPPATARERLAAELGAVARPGAVLDGLSSQSRADLQKMLGALSEPERHELSRADGPWPRARPLLHLAAGGDAADAYYELATSGGAGDELVAARQHAGGASLDDLVESTRSVVERAAARWLRDRAADAASRARISAAWCEKIDRAAGQLRLVSLQRRARELAVELEPSMARWAAVSHAAAWDLDLKAARAARIQVQNAAKGAELEHGILLGVEQTLAAAERAHAASGRKLGLDEALAVAQANLRLGRDKDALAALTPHAGVSAKHLGVATLQELAKTPSLVCPGMPRGRPHPLLCAVAWNKDPRVRKAQAAIERAWVSRGGRYEEAIGAYLGLVHFVPWIYGTYLASRTGSDPERAFGERIARVRVALREAVAASAPFEGVSVFVDTLAGLHESGTRKKPGERVRLTDELEGQLRARATALAKKLPNHRFTQAGLLAVATAVAQERDVTPLLQLLPSPPNPEYAMAAEVLRLWAAVGARDAARVDRAAGALSGLLSQDSASITSATQILLIAEARAAVLGSAREIDVLSRISAQLATDDIPEELRLRAAIDRAGSLARQGSPEEAETTLESVLAKISTDAGSTASDLAAVARGYLLVLRARRAKGEARTSLRAELAQIGQGAELPASILAWRDSWLDELDRLIAEDKCGTMKVCRDRAKKPAPGDQQLAARVGLASASVMRSGVLAAGSLHLNFSFSGELGLMPIVLFEPRLMACELPPRPANPPR